jgi:hypothetical protein
MEALHKKIIEGSGVKPPKNLTDTLKKNFKGVINAEWLKHNENYEAIFYKEGIEHIALFASDGTLTEYKMFVPDGYLPEMIRQTLIQKGEIMNTVLINRGNAVSYEVIIRNDHHQRYLFLVTSMGKVIEERQL